MDKFIFEIFENIQFCARYKELSDTTRKSKERFEKVEKQRVLEILNGLGVKAKYVSKGQFFKIEDVVNNWHLNLHLSIKYGVVEVILGGKNNDTNFIFGGPASLIYESIEYQKGIKSDSYIKDPSFGSYIILEEVLKEIVSIYEDMKKEILINHLA